MKKYIVAIYLIINSVSLLAQGIYNNGAHVVISGSTYLVVDGATGNVQNESGVIDLTGTLKLGGNFTNNVAEADAFGVLATGSEVIFAGTCTQNVGGSSTTIFAFDKITVNPGATVALAADKKFTANGTIVNNGTLTLKTDNTNKTATLLDAGVSGLGTYNAQMYLSAGRNWYVSSPVESATSAVLNASVTNPLFECNEPTRTAAPWTSIANGSTDLAVGKGYIANIQTTGTYTFTGGAFNTGNNTITVTRTAGQTKEGFNLVGNPYPSFVDFASANSTNLQPTYWYYSRNAGNTAEVFDTYNCTSKLGTSLSGKCMTNFIPPMQSFWVCVQPDKCSGTLSFNNALRTHQDVANNEFRIRSMHDVTRPLLRLVVSNGINQDEAIIFFDTNAQDGFDVYDSPKMYNEKIDVPEIFTLDGTQPLVINGLQNVATSPQIPLGFSTQESNSFSIRATEISNFPADINIYIRDCDAVTETQLNVGTPYVFLSDAISTNSRFSILFKSSSGPTVADNTNSNDAVVVFVNAAREIQFNTCNSLAKGVFARVYNSIGQVIMNKALTTSVEKFDPHIPGIYVVELQTTNGTTTKKVIVP